MILISDSGRLRCDEKFSFSVFLRNRFLSNDVSEISWPEADDPEKIIMHKDVNANNPLKALSIIFFIRVKIWKG